MTPFLDGNGVVPFNETGNAEVSLQKRNYEFKKCYLFSQFSESLNWVALALLIVLLKLGSKNFTQSSMFLPLCNI